MTTTTGLIASITPKGRLQLDLHNDVGETHSRNVGPAQIQSFPTDVAAKTPTGPGSANHPPDEPVSFNEPEAEPHAHSPSTSQGGRIDGPIGDPGGCFSSGRPPPGNNEDAERQSKIERYLLSNPEVWLALGHVGKLQGHYYSNKRIHVDKLCISMKRNKKDIDESLTNLARLGLVNVWSTQLMNLLKVVGLIDFAAEHRRGAHKSLAC